MTADTVAQRNVLVLTAAQALGGASPVIVISLGGMVGQLLAPSPAVATLPVSVFQLGLALGTIPAAYIMRRIGRRDSYLIGASIGMFAGLTAAFGVTAGTFALFCLGTFIAGFYNAFVQSYRFAVTDAATARYHARAISWVMVGGMIAAVIGPQVIIWTRDGISGVPFAGAFVGQAVLALLALPVLANFRNSRPVDTTPTSGNGRPLIEILMTPRFMLAAATGLIAYGLMSFVMTAAPIAMVTCGHSVGQAALGIQWHVLAMFSPSFVTGALIARFGKERIAATGLVLIAISAAIALSGLALANFWLSLILLGVGWNFGFIGATAMVAECHTPEERSKAQGANDFMVFGTVAAASFFSGTLLNWSGWATINWLVFPAVALVLVPLLWQAARQNPAVAQ
jgi:MFS family permease